MTYIADVVQRTEALLNRYGVPSEPNLRFLLTDLMHYAHANHIDFPAELQSAVIHFKAEIKDDHKINYAIPTQLEREEKEWKQWEPILNELKHTLKSH